MARPLELLIFNLGGNDENTNIRKKAILRYAFVECETVA